MKNLINKIKGINITEKIHKARIAIVFLSTVILFIVIILIREHIAKTDAGFLNELPIVSSFDPSSRSNFVMSLISIIISFVNAFTVFYIGKGLREKEAAQKGLEWANTLQFNKCSVSPFQLSDYPKIELNQGEQLQKFYKISFCTKTKIPSYIDLDIKKLRINLIDESSQHTILLSNIERAVSSTIEHSDDTKTKNKKDKASKKEEPPNRSYFEKILNIPYQDNLGTDEGLINEFSFYININNLQNNLEIGSKIAHKTFPKYSLDTSIYLALLTRNFPTTLMFTLYGRIGINKEYFRMDYEDFEIKIYCSNPEPESSSTKYKIDNTLFDYEN